MLSKPSAREVATMEYFRSEGGPAIHEHCKHKTKEECRRWGGGVGGGGSVRLRLRVHARGCMSGGAQSIWRALRVKH